MNILALDTSASPVSAALLKDGKLMGEFYLNTKTTHSQTLMPLTEALLKTAGVKLEDIDVFAVNAGPGSFTGVRIGVAAAKGIAFQHNIPCVSVSTLESMAYNMLGSDCVVCALMDARCSQVYNAMFRVTEERVERLCNDRAISLTDLKLDLRNYTEKVVFVGDGARIAFKSLENPPENVFLAPIDRISQNAVSVACAAFKQIKKGNTLTPAELMPVYLRLPQAQRELNKKMGVTE